MKIEESLSHFLAASLFASLAALVLFTGKRTPLKKLFAGYGFCVSWWSFFSIFALTGSGAPEGVFWCRIFTAALIFIPSVFFHFTLCFLRLAEAGRKFVLASYLLSFLFLICDFSPLLIEPAPPGFSTVFHAAAGPLFSYHAGHVLLMVFASLGLLYREMRVKRYRQRRQMLYLLWASALGFLGMAPNYFSMYGRPISILMPYGNLLAAFQGLAVFYLVFRYQFLDIEAMTKKALVFAGLFGVVTGAAAVTGMVQSALGRFLAVPNWAMVTAGAAAVIIFYDPVKRLLVRLTDRFLFRKKEDLKTILNRLSSSILTVLDLDKLGGMILGAFRDSLRLESGAILLLEESGGAYKLFDSFGLERKTVFFDKADPLIRFLDQTRRTIYLERSQDTELLPEAIAAGLNGLKAAVALPLFLHDDLIGILALGKKKSDEEFTKEELDYLPIVSGQAAIALSNARLFDILKKSQIDFAQQAKMAAIGTLSAGISHEIKNPLQVIKGVVEMLKLNKKFGVYDTMNKEQYIAVVEDVSERILGAVARAVGVIDRLSSFAKKPKELKIESVNLEKAVEGALDFLKSEFEYFSITVKKNFDPNCPEVSADQRALEEVILNILVNARHAVMEKGTVSVSTANRGGEVEVTIQDTGQGIKPENLEKIFDPFFTTKDTTRNADPASIKGTGLGLFIVRETVKRFGGRIAVESEVGRGTTFRIILPVPRAADPAALLAKKDASA